MNHRRLNRTELTGIAAGTAAAIVVLAVLSLMLLRPEHTSVKVLAAVWLWSLPVLGIGAALGWSVAQLIQRRMP